MLHYGLLLTPANPHKPLHITTFSDADWFTDLDDGKSTLGSYVYLSPNLVSWWYQKQTLVVRSSTKAKYMSLNNTATGVLWLQSLLLKLQVRESHQQDSSSQACSSHLSICKSSHKTLIFFEVSFFKRSTQGCGQINIDLALKLHKLSEVKAFRNCTSFHKLKLSEAEAFRSCIQKLHSKVALTS
ncbi:hypothetical protein KIW84_031492 [Lathyrus oleraceus]|uniref:Uncharacterized protein n=1 Tax=Pisum sativum TaxID=3888 RepID=A0A9D5B0E2_PEA|nr:hypothetical protein KIW84_031492 [Pisum sativum]